MITNPNVVDFDRAIVREAEEDDDKGADTGTVKLKVKRLTYPDPDRLYDTMVGYANERIIEVDAKLLERVRGGRFEQKHYRSLREMMASPSIRRRVLDTLSAHQLKDVSDQLRESVRSDAQFTRAMVTGRNRVRRLKEAGQLREGDEASWGFDLGMYPDECTLQGNQYATVFPLQDTVLPGTSGPASKQQLFFDYLDMHRKCLAGDTRIALLDGTNPTIQELVGRGPDATFWVYACKDGLVVPALARSPRQTGVMQTFEVELDNGEVIRATANHPFLMRDGHYQCVDQLQPGDSLMPIYRRLSRSNPKGYEQVYHPELDLWETTHHLVARTVHRAQFIWGKWEHTDHINENCRDNRPENIQLLTRQDHFKKTAAHPERRAFAVLLGKRTRTAADNAKMSERQKATWADPAVRARRVAGIQRAVAEGRNHRVVAIRPAGVEPVYDITVPGFSNFGLTAGVFVHNSWEAATRNPLGVRIVNIIPQFVLGRGVVGTIKNAQHQKAWDDFYKLNKMRWRVRQLLKELLIYGEVFNRYFKRPEGLILRQVDPSTIWDIVTDPEDIERIHFYHQQYSILNVSPVPQAAKYNPTRLVIRQIPADQIDHFRINSTTSEKRGRSQLYSILAHLVRFKEFINDRVLLNKMRAMFALDVSVKGSAQDVAAVQEQFNRPIGAGAVLVHNEAAEVEFKNANNNANEAKTDAEMILKVIAVGAGVSEQFLGVSGASTRAGALIQTEPDVKNFETYQETVEDILMAAYERVKVAKKLGDARALMEFTFPALAQEDRSAKLKDIAYCEAMSYICKARAAAMAAKELNISAYDYAQEQAEIEKENKGEPWVAADMQQVPKHAPDPMAMGEMPGLGADMTPGSPEPESGQDDPTKVTQTSGQMGFSAKKLSGRNLANTRPTLNRSSFTRGGEKKSIQNYRSAGAPLRASAHGPRHVWSAEARMRSILTRKERAIARLQEKITHAHGETLTKLHEKLVKKQAELKALREAK